MAPPTNNNRSSLFGALSNCSSKISPIAIALFIIGAAISILMGYVFGIKEALLVGGGIVFGMLINLKSKKATIASSSTIKQDSTVVTTSTQAKTQKHDVPSHGSALLKSSLDQTSSPSDLSGPLSPVSLLQPQLTLSLESSAPRPQPVAEKVPSTSQPLISSASTVSTKKTSLPIPTTCDWYSLAPSISQKNDHDILLFSSGKNVTIAPAQQSGSPWGIYAIGNRGSVCFWNRDTNKALRGLTEDLEREIGEKRLQELLLQSECNGFKVAIAQIEMPTAGLKKFLCFFDPRPGFPDQRRLGYGQYIGDSGKVDNHFHSLPYGREHLSVLQQRYNTSALAKYSEKAR